ncbi:MAG: hypothetical protein ISS25_00350 [Nanoarchaeota archaeon]|nr:hypothetical protein [DPANN group archaeon]MBL7116267.1 hypothetical protein [Nanoarchaeota archaeon]
MEKDDLNYTYDLIITLDERKLFIIKSKKVFIKKRKTKEFREVFSILQDFDFAKIEVELKYLDKFERIHFFVQNKK